MAEDPERAAKFYGDVFGWNIRKWEGPHDYWLLATGEGPGISGGMTKSKGKALSIVNIQVDDVDEAVAKVLAAGGELALAKEKVPGVGYIAYCKDTEGILISLFHPDPSVK